MKYRYLYRVENKKGFGPYHFQNNLSERLQYYHCRGSHPSRGHDLPMFNILTESERYEYYCGFDSIKKLNEWFKGFKSELRAYNYHIYKYKVTDYVSGTSGKQVFFKQKDVLWKNKFREHPKLKEYARI